MNFNFSRNQLIIIFAVVGVIIFFALVFLGVIPGLKTDSGGGFFGGGKQISLVFWGVEKDDFIKPLTERYQKTNPNIRVNYKQIDPKDYEKELVNALAAGRGPDIMMFHNAWLPKHRDKIAAAPETRLTLSAFQEFFPTVAIQDFISENKIYASPLFIDTLALVYNKDVFDANAVALPPLTWNGFQSLVLKLRQIGPGPNYQVVKPAAAIGGSEKSVNAASDLLNLLMFQFGSQLIHSPQMVNFDDPEKNAFDFYIQFGDPLSQYYTWSDNLRYSLDSFSEGQTAVIFNYAAQIPLIKSKSPFLSVGAAPMPQQNPDSPINYADYWGMAVSSQSRNAATAWDFIIFSTTDHKIAEEYLKASGRPPALRYLIQKYASDPDLGVFAKQALTARSWERRENNKIKQIFSDMIESVLMGKLNQRDAMEKARNEINSL